MSRGEQRGSRMHGLRAIAATLAVIALAVPAYAAAPRDEYYEHQWALRDIGAPDAWKVTEGNSAVVAVIDTGVDRSHPDLPRVLEGVDLIDGDGDAADENGHGTLIAGIIAAATDRTGVAGVAPAARILPVRVLGPDGTGDASDVAEGIDWAVGQGAHVINLSLAEIETGSNGLLRAPEVDTAIRRAASEGATVVIAAGNDHEAGGSEPTAYDAQVAGVLVVGASTRSGAPAAYSRYGKGLDLLAPGGGDEADPSDEGCDEESGIVSTWWDPKRKKSGYGAACGTSMAVGSVSGAAALLHTRGYSNRQISARLSRTARDIGPAGRDDRSGAGILDVAAALGVKRARPLTPAPRRTVGPTASPVRSVTAAAPRVPPIKPVPPVVAAPRSPRPASSRAVESVAAAMLLAAVGAAHLVRLRNSGRPAAGGRGPVSPEP